MSEKVIQVKESEFKDLMDQLKAQAERLQSLEEKGADGQAPIVRPRRTTVRKIRVCLVNGLAVIGFANKGTENQPMFVYEAPDPTAPGKMKTYVDLILHGKENDKPIKVGYIDFLQNCEKQEVIVKKIEEEEWVDDQGGATVMQQNVPDGEYNFQSTGVRIPVEAIGKYRTFHVELADGTSLILDERYANMSR